jgi:hypothetical protein
MHPIEHLRHVARATGASGALVAVDAAGALAQMAREDTAGLVPACRRLVEAHLVSGPVWWLCARVLAADDPAAEARHSARELEDDGTCRSLVDALPDGTAAAVVGWPEVAGEALHARGDVEALVVDDDSSGAYGLVQRLLREGSEAALVPAGGVGAAAAVAELAVVEALAAGPSGVLAVPGSLAAAAVAAQAGRPVWAVVATGRVLPARLWDALLARFDDTGVEPWERDAELVPAGLLSAVIGPAGVVEVTAGLEDATCPAAPELLRAAG